MHEDLSAEKAYTLLKEGRHGVAEDAHSHIYLAPIIKGLILEDKFNIHGQKFVEAFGRAVDVNNSPALVVDGIPGFYVIGPAFFLQDGERETLEMKLGFKISKGKCGSNLSHRELKELGLKIKYDKS